MTKIDYKNNVLNYDLKKESRLLQLIEDSVYIDENSRLGDLAWVRYGSTIINSRIGDVAFIGFNCKIENTIISAGTPVTQAIEKNSVALKEKHEKYY